MNRRAIIKNFVFVSVGVSLIPSCMHDKGKASFLLKNISINGDQEKLLADLSETIIPKTSTPGAKDLSSHLFVLMMVDDCYKKEDQQKFMNGLAGFEDAAQKKYNNPFSQCTAVQKNELLSGLESKKDAKDDDVVYFYHTVKRLTVQSFTSSQYYLTNVQVYEMAPGRYHGCVPVKKA